MKLYFHGGAGIVTGVNYLLETSQSKILIDCGLFQGDRKLDKKNQEPFPYQPAEIDFVLITHAHLDHIGRLPKLIEDGFKGQIFATAPTIDFARLMLEDSQKILYEKAVRAGVIPLMDGQKIEKIIKMFKPVEYDQSIKLNQEISVCFREAGHVLGSASIEIEAEDKKIVFSGDLGSGRVPILRKSAQIKEADYVVLESAYGGRVHEDSQASKDMVEDIVEETVARGGILMIPSFALERTQQILYHLNELVENRRIPQIPVFVDSPLAIKLTKIYAQYPQYYNKEAKLLIKSGDDIFKFPGLKLTQTVAESKAINEVAPPKIIIAGSGMSQGGRILHHEIRYLPDPKSTLLIVTYQVQGTLGRKLLEGDKKVKLLDQVIPVKARIEHINGYSGHADQKELIDWLSPIVSPDSTKRPQKIFVCQGEEKPANALAQYIKDHLGLEAEVPEIGQVVELF
jgi:metallo-beta-lactamase family protein